jgi:hypothetical protein
MGKKMPKNNVEIAEYRQVIKSEDNIIFDLIEISKKPNVNIELLLKDAFSRGLNTGKELAKRKAIEAIEQEK